MPVFTILHDGEEIPPSGTPPPAPNTYEISAIPTPAPAPGTEFPLSIQWQSEGADLGRPNVRTLNFIAALDQFLVSRGTGEQSNVVTVRKLASGPSPPPVDPYIEDVILLLTAKAGLTVDQSPLNNDIYVSAGDPSIVYDDPNFPLGAYDVQNGRLGNRDVDDVPALFGAGEYTIDWSVVPKVLPPNLNSSYIFAGGFNLDSVLADGSFTAGMAIGGSSYSVAAPPGTLVVGEMFQGRLTRTNGDVAAYLRLYGNGVKIGDSTTFGPTEIVNPAVAEDRQVGYDATTGALMTDIRYTKDVNRSRLLDTYTPPTPGSMPVPAQPVRPCTWDPFFDGNSTLSLSNTLATVVDMLSTEQGKYARPATGNWYFEITVTQTAAWSLVGLCRPAPNGSSYLGSDALGWGYAASDGRVYNNGGSVAYGSSYTGATVVVGVQLVAGSMVCWVGGVAQGVGVITGLTGWLLPAHGVGNLGTFTALINTAGPFSQALPSGASAWGPF